MSNDESKQQIIACCIFLEKEIFKTVIMELCALR